MPWIGKTCHISFFDWIINPVINVNYILLSNMFSSTYKSVIIFLLYTNQLTTNNEAYI